MNQLERSFGRGLDGLRPIAVSPGPLPFAEGSALIDWGRTRVLCAVSVSEAVPDWLSGRGRGWLTAQYAMLPRATTTRSPRPGYEGEVSGRAREIQRLIGRALRAGLDLQALGERLLTVDCDVLVADGGTRCAAITGAWVAVRLALRRLVAQGALPTEPLAEEGPIWAVSAGLVDGSARLDLDAAEDQRAEADFNFALAGPERLIEIQGTGERRTFAWAEVERLFALCREAAGPIQAAQARALEG